MSLVYLSRLSLSSCLPRLSPSSVSLVCVPRLRPSSISLDYLPRLSPSSGSLVYLPRLSPSSVSLDCLPRLSPSSFSVVYLPHLSPSSISLPRLEGMALLRFLRLHHSCAVNLCTALPAASRLSSRGRRHRRVKDVADASTISGDQAWPAVQPAACLASGQSSLPSLWNTCLAYGILLSLPLRAPSPRSSQQSASGEIAPVKEDALPPPIQPLRSNHPFFTTTNPLLRQPTVR